MNEKVKTSLIECARAIGTALLAFVVSVLSNGGF